MFDNISDIEQNKTNFRDWLDRNSSGKKPEYKDHLVDILERRLESKLPGMVGNLFRFDNREINQFLEVAKSILLDARYPQIDKKDRNKAPSAAISNFYKFLGGAGNWKQVIEKTVLIDRTLKKSHKPILVNRSMTQKIFFGAPGTGKSYKVNALMNDLKVAKVFRTTFHPDYDYAQFVGGYKPKKSGSVITYEFIPQVFANALKVALETPTNNPVYLVIEEINRGNCAQIFGDIFQLLDRDENGESCYGINVDSDFAEWLVKEKVIQNVDEKIKLPPNFNILATMNTSDQSLFPMDSAFKRRFDWEYVPIDFEGKDCANYQIKIDDEKSYSWQKFVESVNTRIFDITDSEDKQLGEYFIKLIPADNGIITKDRFLGKVMFYLWNEVCKDVHKQESFFRESENGTYFSFQDLYKKNGNEKLISFMDWIAK